MCSACELGWGISGMDGYVYMMGLYTAFRYENILSNLASCQCLPLRKLGESARYLTYMRIQSQGMRYYIRYFLVCNRLWGPLHEVKLRNIYTTRTREAQ
jgi:hypothetical protein